MLSHYFYIIMYKFIDEEKEVEEVINYCKELSVLSIDTETQGFDPHTKNLLLLQIGNREKQFVIDCSKISPLHFKEVIESKLCIAHNMKFDWRFLYHNGIDIKNIYDTFLAECILTTGYERGDGELGLADLTEKYLGFKLDKSIRGEIHKQGLSTEVIEYAAKDIAYLEDIMNIQLEKITEFNLHTILNLENEVCRVFAKMEYDGISFNSNKLKEVIVELSEINKSLEKSLDEIIVEESHTNKKLIKYTQIQQDLFTQDIRKTIINWKSPKQKTDILNKLNIAVNSVDDKTLQKLKNTHKIVPLYIELSKYSKLESSFGTALLKFINPVTKRIHSNVWQILSTGRISMSEPNCQQIPAHSNLGQTIKSCFVASDGYKIVSADFSGKIKIGMIIVEYILGKP